MSSKVDVDEIQRTGWHRMIEDTLATNGSLFRCIFSSHLQELDFLTENTLFPVKMTVSVASEVAKVKRTQEFKVVVFNERTGYANMPCVAVWLRVKEAA